MLCLKDTGQNTTSLEEGKEAHYKLDLGKKQFWRQSPAYAGYKRFVYQLCPTANAQQ